MGPRMLANAHDSFKGAYQTYLADSVSKWAAHWAVLKTTHSRHILSCHVPKRGADLSLMKQGTTAARLDPSFCPTPSPSRCHPFDTCDINWIEAIITCLEFFQRAIVGLEPSLLALNSFREQYLDWNHHYLPWNFFREQICEMQDCPPEWKVEGWTKVFRSWFPTWC